MHFDDLTAYRYYLPFELLEVRNIGWLDASHPYSIGEISNNFVSKMHEIICARRSDFDAHVNVIRGIHPCNLCGEECIEIPCTNSKVLLGMSEIWIPTSNGYFASPSMVLHYIEAHGYAPPGVFIGAAMAFDLHQPFNAQVIYDKIIARENAI